MSDSSSLLDPPRSLAETFGTDFETAPGKLILTAMLFSKCSVVKDESVAVRVCNFDLSTGEVCLVASAAPPPAPTRSVRVCVQ